MGGGTGENALRRESLLGAGSCPSTGPGPSGTPGELGLGAVHSQEKKGGAKGARKGGLCPKPHTAGTPSRSESGVDPRAGTIPTSQATSPEPQTQPDLPSQMLLNCLDFLETTSCTQTFPDLGLGPTGRGPCSPRLHKVTAERESWTKRGCFIFALNLENIPEFSSCISKLSSNSNIETPMG